mmetsp:Transcript_86959/g.241156  ORF Transcript_86959/g.241156 Transcript_86959/m.241156 type:complete len:258 (-) Transcript_86959:917-1690(-)
MSGPRTTGVGRSSRPEQHRGTARATRRRRAVGKSGPSSSRGCSIPRTTGVGRSTPNRSPGCSTLGPRKRMTGRSAMASWTPTRATSASSSKTVVRSPCSCCPPYHRWAHVWPIVSSWTPRQGGRARMTSGPWAAGPTARAAGAPPRHAGIDGGGRDTGHSLPAQGRRRRPSSFSPALLTETKALSASSCRTATQSTCLSCLRSAKAGAVRSQLWAPEWCTGWAKTRRLASTVPRTSSRSLTSRSMRTRIRRMRSTMA